MPTCRKTLGVPSGRQMTLTGVVKVAQLCQTRHFDFCLEHRIFFSENYLEELEGQQGMPS